jgi:exodeoxyribonuclease-3
MRVVSWNVNSIKVRRERLLGWLTRHAPDVVCLQELKAEEDAFPFDDIRTAGFHAVVAGQKAYNGVAILAREEPAHVTVGFPGDGQARYIAATVRGVRIHCVYVPNGRAVGTDAFAYKLGWLARLSETLASDASRWSLPHLVAGDFNCATEDRDVHRTTEWADSVLCHADVRAAIGAFALVDTFRMHQQGDGFYSWWDYRMLGFPKNNGLRIDLILADSKMASRCANAWIDRDERKGARPSDHAPVVADFADP